MYFVYQKQINVASEQNYDVDSIVEWLQNYIDGDYIKTVYEKDITAKDIVDDIFYNPDDWYDDFIQSFNVEQDVIDNMTQNDLSQQIEEVAKDKLLDYYTKNLEELKFEEWC